MQHHSASGPVVVHLEVEPNRDILRERLVRE